MLTLPLHLPTPSLFHFTHSFNVFEISPKSPCIANAFLMLSTHRFPNISQRPNIYLAHMWIVNHQKTEFLNVQTVHHHYDLFGHRCFVSHRVPFQTAVCVHAFIHKSFYTNGNSKINSFYIPLKYADSHLENCQSQVFFSFCLNARMHTVRGHEL